MKEEFDSIHNAAFSQCPNKMAVQLIELLTQVSSQMEIVMLQNGIPAEMAKEDVATFMRGGSGALYATTDNQVSQDVVFQQGTTLAQELAMTKQKLAIMHKLVDELRTYIEMLELAQPDEEGSIDMNAVAKKLGMNSQKDLYEFLHDRAGLPDVAEIK